MAARLPPAGDRRRFLASAGAAAGAFLALSAREAAAADAAPPPGGVLDLREFIPPGATDHTASFEAAFKALEARRGGMLFVPNSSSAPSGRYLVTGRLTLRSRVFLFGEGASSRIRMEGGNLALGGAESVEIRSLRFEGSGRHSAVCADPGGAPTRVRIAANEFEDCGIDINCNLEELSILDNVLRGRNAAITLNGDCRRALIAGNTVSNRENAKGHHKGGINVLTAGEQSVISGNLVSGCAESGIYVTTASNMVISGNVCTGNGTGPLGGSGIGLNNHLPGRKPRLITVSGNVCSGNRDDGIDVNNRDTRHDLKLSITGNICSGNRQTGINVNFTAGAALAGNVCESNRHSGIQAGTSSRLSITGNYCQGNNLSKAARGVDRRSGITLINSTHCTVTGNVCADQGDSPTQVFGIEEVAGCSDNVLSANVVDGNVVGGAEGGIRSDGDRTLLRGNVPNDRPGNADRGPGGIRAFQGQGEPKGLAAPVGSTYVRTDGGPGSTFYVKEDGGSTAEGWAAK